MCLRKRKEMIIRYTPTDIRCSLYKPVISFSFSHVCHICVCLVIKSLQSLISTLKLYQYRYFEWLHVTAIFHKYKGCCFRKKSWERLMECELMRFTVIDGDPVKVHEAMKRLSTRNQNIFPISTWLWESKARGKGRKNWPGQVLLIRIN